MKVMMTDFEKYEKVNTTNGVNAYSSNIDIAYVGFENAAEVNRFAKEHNCNIVRLHKRDGWKLWEREQVTFAEDFEINGELFGADYVAYTCHKDINEEIFNLGDWLKDAQESDNKCAMLNFAEGIRNLIKIVEKYKDVLEDDNKQIITTFSSNYGVCDVYPIKTISFYNDTHHYTYGVVPIKEEE